METFQSYSTLSLDELELLESMCGRLDQEVNNDFVPVIEEMLEGVDERIRNNFFTELLWHNIESRQKNGQVPVASEYRFSRNDDQQTANEVISEHNANAKFMALEKSRGPVPNQSELPTRYEKIEEIGRGGIGCVWRVLDKTSQRPLAVKTLRSKLRSNRQANLRLEREAILTGILQHPGIPPIHNHGCLVDGSPFFTMKLVEGKTLEQILKDRRPQESDTQHAIGIFEKVAQTLAYAHSQQVIHRDLKPQNIMVGQFAEVQVMDWGMAKRLNGSAFESKIERKGDKQQSSTAASESGITPMHASTVNNQNESSLRNLENELTQMGDVIGTPAYMSPEQACGQHQHLDSSSDVYSLGAILFEILTGEQVVSGETTAEVLEKVRTGDLAVAMQMLNSSPADSVLVDLCRRCLSHDQAARPRDAGMIANELSTHFANTQIRIRATEIELRATEVRANEELKRRKTFTRMLVLTVGVFAAGLAGVLWQWNKSVAAEGLAKRNAVNFKEAAALAELNAAKHQKAATEAKTNAKNYSEGMKIFVDAFQSANPERGANSNMSASDVLRQAHATAKQSNLEEGGKRMLLKELGKCFRWTGEYQLAVETTEESVRLHTERYGEEHPNTLTELNGLGIVYLMVGRYQDALPLLENTVRLNRSVRGSSHLETLRSMMNLASGYMSTGEIGKAHKLNKQLLEAGKQALGPKHPETLTMMNNLAASLREMGNLDEAAKLLQRAIDLSQEVRGESHPETLNSMLNLADVYGKTGQAEKAIQINQKMVGLTQEKLGENHPLLFRAQNNLAYLFNRTGKSRDAIVLLEPVLVSQAKLLGKAHVDTLKTMLTLAIAHKQTGNLQRALEIDKEAFEMLTHTLGKDHPETLTAVNNLAHTYFLLGRKEDALPYLRTSLEANQRKYGKAHPQTLLSMNNLSILLKSIGKLQESLVLDEEKLQLCLEHLGKTDHQTLMTLNSLSATYVLLGRVEEAKENDETLFEYLDMVTGPSRRETTLSLSALANHYDANKLFEQALKINKRNLAICQVRFGKDHKQTITMSYRVADGYRWTNNLEPAIPILSHSLQLLRAKLGDTHDATLEAMNKLAVFQELNDNPTEARALLSESLKTRNELQQQDWRRFETESQLGGVLLTIGETDTATELLESGYEGLKRVSNSIPNDVRTETIKGALERLVRLSDAQGKKNARSKWQQLLKELTDSGN